MAWTRNTGGGGSGGGGATATAAPLPPPPPLTRTWWGAAKTYSGRGLTLFGASALLSAAGSAYVRYRARTADAGLPEEFVLELDLARLRLVDKVDASPLALLRGEAAAQVALPELQKALEAAGKDGRVRGLLATFGSGGGRESVGGLGLAGAQELHGMLHSFRLAAGARAPTVAFAPAFGEAGGNASTAYLAATGCASVYAQPSGHVSLTGFEAQGLFARGLLDKWGVKPIFFTREEYKSAANVFTQCGFTDAHRANTVALLSCLSEQLLSSVAAARRLTHSVVTDAIDAAPLVPASAASLGLLDGVRYRDQVTAQFQKSEALLAREQKKWAAAERWRGLLGSAPSTPPDVRMSRVPLQKYLAVQQLKEAAGLGSWADDTPWTAGWAALGRMLSRREAAAGNASSASGKADASGGGGSGSGGAGGESGSADTTSSERPEQTADRRNGSGAASGTGATKRGGKGDDDAAASAAAAAAARVPLHKRPRVAVMTLSGSIMQGPAPPGGAPGGGGRSIDAATLAPQLDALARDPMVKAVVVRINSPGGSALGSDTLHHALTRVRESGKPVVVSMGDVAASGGMFIAAAADHIVAQPATLTGSIGVVTGKFNVSKLLEDAGIATDSVKVGGNVDMLSPFKDLSPEQEAAIQALIDTIYSDFVEKVAAGRKKTAAEVRALAKGRVYTGTQALSVGLVDQLGGLSDAVAAAKRAAGLPLDDAACAVVEFPPRKEGLLVRMARVAAVSRQQQGEQGDGGGGGVSELAAGLVDGYVAAMAAAAAAAAQGKPYGGGAVAMLAGAAAPLLLPPGAARGLAPLAGVVERLMALDGQVGLYSAEADVMAATLS